MRMKMIGKRLGALALGLSMAFTAIGFTPAVRAEAATIPEEQLYLYFKADGTTNNDNASNDAIFMLTNDTVTEGNQTSYEDIQVNGKTVIITGAKVTGAAGINLYGDGYQSLQVLLNVAEGRGRKEKITGEAKTWLLSIACMKPKDLGYSAETWTTSALTKHIRLSAKDAGYDRLTTITESGVYKILDKANIKPFRIQYYCERRDPDFDDKMHNVLLVYKQLSLQFDESRNLLPFGDDEVTHILSYDEKPGIQAIANVAEDKMPNKNNGVIKRDYEYKRLGTLSLLAGIDLQTGEAIPLVSDTHNSQDYIEFLKKLDNKYPAGDKIRLILDNLKVHSSQKVVEYLEANPDRFEFVFTPKHASWLNLVEGFFSKMTKQMLHGIRVDSKQELEDRIYKYFDEINAEPVVYHWSWNLDDVDADEVVNVQTSNVDIVNV